MKTMCLDDFLTRKEIARAQALYRATSEGPEGYARLVCAELIRPNIARINAALGQPNDPMYLAYAVEYAMRQAR